ncbi:MAG: hypothetical protein RSB34_02130 [Muribaculaceae bacterium]
MINAKVISNIYKLHKKPPSNISDLGIEKMRKSLIEFHKFNEESGFLILENVSEESPFKKIPISRIYGIENFDKTIALVLPNSILFFSKTDSKINIHLRMPRLSRWQKIKGFFKGEK